MNDSGFARLQFSRRLGGDWRDLADYLDVPAYQQQAFGQGDEARGLWDWLAVRERLGDLPAALRAIGRPDLADSVVGTAEERKAVRTAVIMTAIGVETLAVLAHMREYPDDLGEREVGGTLYETGTFVGDRSTWRVSVAEVGPGSAAAAAEVERARAAFSPDAIVFVGVAGGIKDVALGDVVAADAVYGYGIGADTIKTQPSSHRLVQHARRVARHGQWQRRVLEPTARSVTARALVKPIAAGDEVVAGSESRVADLLRRHCSDAVAVETAGFGLLDAAYRSASLEALVVRGVSDLPGGRAPAADERWQSIAAGHAAAFAFTVLDNAGRGDDDAAANPSAGDPGRYTVNITGSQGVQIGDHNTQHNTWR